MKRWVRFLGLVASASLLSACAASNSTVVPVGPDLLYADGRSPLSRAQQDAIRASTRVDPRFVADVEGRSRMAARHRDRTYGVATRGSSGRAVKSNRSARLAYEVVQCETIYLNLSGTYDTSTDPILSQVCNTVIYDDGLPPVDRSGGGGGGDASGDPSLVSYGEPWSNFDTPTERACKTAKTKFISLSKNAQDTNQVPSPGQTNCGPKNNNSELEVVGGVIFFPSVCDFSVTLSSDGVSINPLSGSNRPPQTNQGADGVRINANCSFDFVRI